MIGENTRNYTEGIKKEEKQSCGQEITDAEVLLNDHMKTSQVE